MKINFKNNTFAVSVIEVFDHTVRSDEINKDIVVAIGNKEIVVQAGNGDDAGDASINSDSYALQTLNELLEENGVETFMFDEANDLAELIIEVLDLADFNAAVARLEVTA